MSNIKSRTEIKLIREQLKQQNKKVVFTNGCFDLIHSGHVDYLVKAKDMGDRLGAGTTDGKPFTDSRGRVYVRDDKGTIRRIKTP